MSLIEVEVYESVFCGLVQLLASAAAIPVPTLEGLGSDRLLHDLFWGLPTLGDSGGPAAPVNGQMVKVPLDVTHLSIAELRTDSHATGKIAHTTAWLSVTMDSTRLTIALVRIDMPHKPNQIFSPPLVLQSDDLPIQQTGGTIVGAAILRSASDKIVTIRFATTTFDSLTAPPQDRLATHSDGSNWLIRVSGNYLAESVRLMLSNNLDELPSGTVLEDPPQAAWSDVDSSWGIDASVGLEQIDVCPTVFGAVDMSVALLIRINLQPDVATKKVVLKLHVGHDVSDWDSFRCWAGLGFVVASFLALLNPIVGIITALGSAIAYGVGISALTSGVVSDQQLAGVKKIATEGDDDVTYQTKIQMPSLPTGTIYGAGVGANGLDVWGVITTIAASHKRSINPLAVGRNWVGGFDCGSHKWSPELDLPVIGITDQALIAGTSFSHPPVTVFSTAIEPTNHWTFTRSGSQISVKPVGTIATGQTGILFVHSSIGLRRVEIGPVPALPKTPSPVELAQMNVDCMQFAPAWPSGHFNFHWLVDPPPTRVGIPALRQWMATIQQLTGGSALTFQPTRAGKNSAPALIVTAGADGCAFLEMCTERDEELLVDYRGKSELHVRVSQRWLIPSAVIELGGPPLGFAKVDSNSVGLLTANRILVVHGEHGVIGDLPANGAQGLVGTDVGVVAWGPTGASLLTNRVARSLTSDAVTGTARLANGRLALHSAGGVFTVEASGLRSVASAPPAAAARSPQLASITVGGKVMAVRGNQLFITQPWGMRSAAKAT